MSFKLKIKLKSDNTTIDDNSYLLGNTCTFIKGKLYNFSFINSISSY